MLSNKFHIKVLITLQVILLVVLCVPLSSFSIENSNTSNADPDNFKDTSQNDGYTPIRDLLSDKSLSDNKIYIRGGNKEGKGVVNQFVENITMDLLEDITEFDSMESMNYYMGHDSLIAEINQYKMFNGEIREVNYIKRRMATGAVLNSAMKYFETTPIYNDLKSFEESISKYFIIEYRKGISDNQGALYLPGALTPEKQTKDNLYKISLSTLFYSSTDSFKGYYSLEFKFSYLGTETSTLYDFGKNEFKFRLKNDNLNSYLSSNWDFTVIHSDTDTTTFLLKMLFNY